MSVGHPDYWRRMVTRVTVEGYAPEYYEGWDQRQINAGAGVYVITYPIVAGYLFNLTGWILNCDEPGINTAVIGKSGGNSHYVIFDTHDAFYMPQGLTQTLQYGETFRVYIANQMAVNATFTTSILGILEYEG